MFSQRTPYINLVLLSVALFLLVLLLPSINDTDYPNATITSKMFFFIWGLIIISVIYIFGILFKRISLSEFKLSKIDICVFLLLTFITVNRYVIQPDYSFSIRYLELLGLSVLYVILRSLILKNYIWLLTAIIISGIIQAVYGNLQLLGYYSSNHSGFKLTGSFFNPGPYAGFLAIVWPVALGMYLFKEKIIEQVLSVTKSNSKLVKIIITYVFEYIPLLGIISIALVIPSTHSRGAWLAILLSSLFLIEFRYHYIKLGLKKIARTKKVIFMILVGGLLSLGLFGIYNLKKGSADGRLFIWKVTSEIIKDHPITGVGFDRFKAHYMNYQSDYFAEHGETAEALVADNTYYAFNEWLQFLSENGLIGLLLLAMVLYALFKTKVAQENNFLFLIIKGTLLALGIFALFSYPMQILPIKLAIVIMLALLPSLDVRTYSLFCIDKNAKPYMQWGFKIIIFTLGIVGLSKGVAYTQTLDLGFKTWQKGLTIYQYGDYEGAIEEYAIAYPILKKEGDFLMNYGKALTMVKQNKKAIIILGETKRYLNTTIVEAAMGDAYKATKQYSKAETAYQNAANMIPVRFYPLYLQAKLFVESGEKQKAIVMANTILNKDIKVPSTAIKEIMVEMKKIINDNE